MISKTFTGTTQYSAPVFMEANQKMALSVSGTFVGTVDLQRLVQNDNVIPDYPSPGDAGWHTVNQYTTATEDLLADGDNCWYRFYCSAFTSGSIVTKIKVS